MNKKTILVVALAAVAALLPGAAQAGQPERVRLSQVSALSLYAGKTTEARRSAPIPQMSCVGGPCRDANPDVIQCRNVGSDGYDQQWECQANLPDGISFGTTTVSCEGFEYPNDPYILKGSCGVEYTLRGKRTGSDYEGSSSHYHTYPSYSHGHSSGGYGGFWALAGLVLLGCMLCGGRQRSYGSYGGGYGGGYSRGWGSGWGGFGTGAALGYMMAPRRSYGYGYGGGRAGRRGWGGGMRTGGGMRRSTGFGGTRRR